MVLREKMPAKPAYGMVYPVRIEFKNEIVSVTDPNTE